MKNQCIDFFVFCFFTVNEESLHEYFTALNEFMDVVQMKAPSSSWQVFYSTAFSHWPVNDFAMIVPAT